MLTLKNINWTASDGEQILKNINLTIPDNRLVAISGPNGGGKTTLARILMGVEQPTSGQILYNGQDITNTDVTDRAKLGISFGFQQPIHFKGITVRRLLCLAAGETLNDEELCLLLQKVGLCARNYMDRDIDSTLSGGEIKRIEIASVLARDSSFVIFDEPEAGIDIWSFERLIGVFDEMRREKNRTMIIISHQERILKIADEIVILANGEVSDQGDSSVMMEKMLQKDCKIARCCGQTKVNYHEK